MGIGFGSPDYIKKLRYGFAGLGMSQQDGQNPMSQEAFDNLSRNYDENPNLQSYGSDPANYERGPIGYSAWQNRDFVNRGIRGRNTTTAMPDPIPQVEDPNPIQDQNISGVNVNLPNLPNQSVQSVAGLPTPPISPRFNSQPNSTTPRLEDINSQMTANEASQIQARQTPISGLRKGLGIAAGVGSALAFQDPTIGFGMYDLIANQPRRAAIEPLEQAHDSLAAQTGRLDNIGKIQNEDERNRITAESSINVPRDAQMETELENRRRAIAEGRTADQRDVTNVNEANRIANEKAQGEASIGVQQSGQALEKQKINEMARQNDISSSHYTAEEKLEQAKLAASIQKTISDEHGVQSVHNVDGNVTIVHGDGTTNVIGKANPDLHIDSDNDGYVFIMDKTKPGTATWLTDTDGNFIKTQPKHVAGAGSEWSTALTNAQEAWRLNHNGAEMPAEDALKFMTSFKAASPLAGAGVKTTETTIAASQKADGIRLANMVKQVVGGSIAATATEAEAEAKVNQAFAKAVAAGRFSPEVRNAAQEELNKFTGKYSKVPSKTPNAVPRPTDAGGK